METKDNFIVAIEIGSSKITGIAGRKQPDGALQIMAAVQDRGASAFIRKGRINNLLKMTACIKSIKDKLEKKLNRSITQAYIGIGGMGMHSELNTVLKNFPEKTQISSSVVDSIQDENRQSQPAEREILPGMRREGHAARNGGSDLPELRSANCRRREILRRVRQAQAHWSAAVPLRQVRLGGPEG